MHESLFGLAALVFGVGLVALNYVTLWKMRRDPSDKRFELLGKLIAVLATPFLVCGYFWILCHFG